MAKHKTTKLGNPEIPETMKIAIGAGLEVQSKHTKSSRPEWKM
jgi:hypothetical protein